jgi:hypothetical protein
LPSGFEPTADHAGRVDARQRGALAVTAANDVSGHSLDMSLAATTIRVTASNSRSAVSGTRVAK